MMVVFFKSEMRPEADGPEYAETLARMRDLVTRMPGFVSIKAFSADDGETIDIIRFESEEALNGWRNHPEHRKVQQRGREFFYRRYWIQVCKVIREYEFERDGAGGVRRELATERRAPEPPSAILGSLVEKDISITARALAKLALAAPQRSHLRKVAEDFLSMARAYHEDAKHFRQRGELDKALATVNYAHGWLDAGARIGLFDVGGDDSLFTLSE